VKKRSRVVELEYPAKYGSGNPAGCLCQAANVEEVSRLRKHIAPECLASLEIYGKANVKTSLPAAMTTYCFEFTA
jgi:hypothetical protein